MNKAYNKSEKLVYREKKETVDLEEEVGAFSVPAFSPAYRDFPEIAAVAEKLTSDL